MIVNGKNVTQEIFFEEILNLQTGKLQGQTFKQSVTVADEKILDAEESVISYVCIVTYENICIQMEFLPYNDEVTKQSTVLTTILVGPNPPAITLPKEDENPKDVWNAQIAAGKDVKVETTTTKEAATVPEGAESEEDIVKKLTEGE